MEPNITPDLNAIDRFIPDSKDLPPFAELLALAKVDGEHVGMVAKDENTPAEWQGLMGAGSED